MSSSAALLISAVQLCDSATSPQSVAGPAAPSRRAFIIRIPKTGGYGRGGGMIP